MHNHSIALRTLLPTLFPVGIDALSHSQRIAAIGSIRAARNAGRSEATLAIKVSAATEPSSTQGSRAVVPDRKLPSARETTRAMVEPATLPIPATPAFSGKTNRVQ